MKKILSCLLAVLLLASLTVTAFATSPEKPEEVEVVEAVAPAEEVKSELVGVEDSEMMDVSEAIELTLDTDKDALSDEAKAEYEAAEKALEDLDAVIAETEGLDDVVDGREVGVSAMFDISAKEGEELNFPLTLKLKIPSPETFVALLQYNGEKFELLETELEDDVLTFTVEYLCPFAIISLAE